MCSVVANVFNINAILDAVIIGDNMFTGSLPTELFNSSLLHTFIASKNCFSGSISSELCNAVNLETLALSGMTAASGCAFKLSFGAFSVLPVDGSLPKCLFQMPHLTQFFAAGNKVYGSLYELPATSVLENLTLSYNRLHGKIPISIETHTGFNVLDLSFNSLVGTVEQMSNYSLSSSDPEPVSVNLESNLLSGRIPPSFVTATTYMNLLSGNMFECRTDADLPQADPRSHSYSCGSDLLDVFLYMWCVLVVLACIGGLYLWVSSRDSKDVDASTSVKFKIADTMKIMMSLTSYKASRGSVARAGAAGAAEALILHSGHVLAQFRRFCFRVTMVIAFVFMPLFTVASFADESTSSSQTYQYGWTISMAFVKGDATAIAVAVTWSLMLLYFMYFEGKYINRTPITLTVDPDTNPGVLAVPALWR